MRAEDPSSAAPAGEEPGLWLGRFPQPLRSWLILSHVTVLLLPLVAILATGALADDLRKQTRSDLQHQGALLALLVEQIGRPEGGLPPRSRIEPLLRRARDATLAGIRVIDLGASVVASSGDQLGENLAHHPEVLQALAGLVASAERPRDATYAPLDSMSRRARVRLYVAVPIESADGRVLGAILLSRTPREELQALYHMAPRLSWGLLVASILTLSVALYAAWFFTRSLARLAAAALRVADGEAASIAELRRPARSRVLEVRSLALATTTMAEGLQQRLAYISEFAGNVSHEFKTPISTLRGSVELLLEDDEMPPAQQQRFLTNALAELARMQRLIDGLLSLARAEEGAGVRSRIPLQELLEEASARWDATLEGEAQPIVGQRGQIAAVIENLLRNARHHGGEEAVISVRAFTRGSRTGCAVIDTGPGISEANQKHIFERFFTTARTTGGTGLGLPLVAAVVRRHGGEVSVESRPGRTVFTVELPAAH